MTHGASWVVQRRFVDPKTTKSLAKFWAALCSRQAFFLLGIGRASGNERPAIPSAKRGERRSLCEQMMILLGERTTGDPSLRADKRRPFSASEQMAIPLQTW